MDCPSCGDSNAIVLVSRKRPRFIWRRRRCPNCGHRWTTREIPLEHSLPHHDTHFGVIADAAVEAMAKAPPDSQEAEDLKVALNTVLRCTAPD